jgi:acetyltransferase-like isoleucine patch superfamily enzyme/glycosyltransferase involved in cell wall biosynthesis
VEALDSAFAQTYPNLRIIICDDASTDGTPEVIRKHLAETGHQDVRFVAHEQNKGLCASLNEMLELVDGDYVAFISADDTQEPDRFEVQVARMEELGSDYGICYSNMYWADQNGTLRHSLLYEHSDMPSGDIFASLLREYFLSTPSLLFRTSTLRNAGPYDENLRAEDYDMTLRVARTNGVTYVDAPLVSYRRLDGSLWDEMQNDTESLLGEIGTVLKKHRGISREYDEIISLRLVAFAKARYLAGAGPASVRSSLLEGWRFERRPSTLVYILLCTVRFPGPKLATAVERIRTRRLKMNAFSDTQNEFDSMARTSSIREAVNPRERAAIVYNRVITHIPLNPLRVWVLQRLGAQIGPDAYLFGGSEVLAPHNLVIDGQTHIGRFCQIDARGGIRIGRNAVIASHCLMITADHDPDDPGFPGRLGPIEIGDRVWIGSRVTVLKDVTIGEGAVVAAGSVVTQDVAPWTKVAGVPARPVGTRPTEQTYEITYGPSLY